MPRKSKIYETKAGVPIVDGFDYPVGSRQAEANVYDTHYVAAGLAEDSYYSSFKVWHTGEDWNGKGGGDTDLGNPVYAVAHGRVADFGHYTPSWGNVVLLEHALPDGALLWTQYAHLDEISVEKKGAVLHRGDPVGTIGKGEKTAAYPNGKYPAHLHFEIRKEPLRIDMWRPIVNSQQQVLAYYHDPRKFIAANRPATFKKYKPPRGRPAHDTKPDLQTLDGSPVAEMLPPNSFGRWPGDPAGYSENVYEASFDRPFHDSVDVYGKPFRYKLTSPTHDVTVGYHVFLPEAGRYIIEAFIPAQYSSERRAGYYVTHYIDGQQTVRRVEIDQKVRWDVWVSLGEYDLDPIRPADGLVNVVDQSHEVPSQLIAFSGVRWRSV